MITIALDAGASFLKGALFQDGALIRRSIRQAPAVNVQGHREPRQILQLLSYDHGVGQSVAKDETLWGLYRYACRGAFRRS